MTGHLSIRDLTTAAHQGSTELEDEVPSTSSTVPSMPFVYHDGTEREGLIRLFTEEFRPPEDTFELIRPMWNAETRVFSAPCEVRNVYVSTGSRGNIQKILRVPVANGQYTELRTRSARNLSFMSSLLPQGMDTLKALISTRPDSLVNVFRVVPSTSVPLPVDITDRNELSQAQAVQWTFFKQGLKWHEVNYAGERRSVRDAARLPSKSFVSTVLGQVDIQVLLPGDVTGDEASPLSTRT